jgi:catechol 2,3-dioxygenase-like lactoylglutathione lyase family enzyme
MIQVSRAHPEFEDISPTFRVSNITSALAFYCERLGFELGWIWGDPPTHANVCRGAISVNLTLEPTKAGRGEAYVELSGVDAYCDELRARSVEWGELNDRPYGMRDFAITDPDGNRLVFGEPTVE